MCRCFLLLVCAPSLVHTVGMREGAHTSSTVNFQANSGSVDRLAAQAKALGDATRLKIFEYISASSTPEVCVCDIVDYVQKSQATVSHHLRILRDANLIVGERRGTWVWYQVDSGVFSEFIAGLSLLGKKTYQPNKRCRCEDDCNR